jgi:hypothetical protein
LIHLELIPYTLPVAENQDDRKEKGCVSVAAVGSSSGTAQKRNINPGNSKAACDITEHGQKTSDREGGTTLSPIVLFLTSSEI